MATKTPRYKRVVICLHGDADSGKSSTLLELAEILRAKCLQYAEFKKLANSFDKCILIKVFGKFVGIGTYGDEISMVEKTIKKFSSKRDKAFPSIIVTASHERLDRKNKAQKKTGLKLKDLAVWNIPKVVFGNQNSIGRQDLVCVSGVGTLLHYVVKAARMWSYTDIDFV